MNGFQTGVKRAKEKHVCELLGELLKKQFGGVPQYEPVYGYSPLPFYTHVKSFGVQCSS